MRVEANIPNHAFKKDELGPVLLSRERNIQLLQVQIVETKGSSNLPNTISETPKYPSDETYRDNTTVTIVSNTLSSLFGSLPVLRDTYKIRSIQRL